jgi:hypothetical protein
VKLGVAIVCVAFAAACGGSSAARIDAPAAAADVDALVEHVRSAHPDPWHDVRQAEFAAAAQSLRARIGGLDADEALVELMRLSALLGSRDGHSGVFPLDTHRRPLRLYPVRLFAFADGVRVVAQVGAPSGLVGARLVSIGGHEPNALATLVRPLVPADNEQSREARLWQWAVVAEVLHGLGLTRSAGAAVFAFELPNGRVVERELVPVPAQRYAAAFTDLFHPMVPQGLPRRSKPPFLARRLQPAWGAALGGGRVAYVALNVTLGASGGTAASVVRRLVRRPAVRGVVVDLRHNPGGENAAYEPLLAQLLAIAQRERIVVLTSRTTFSAAANFLADLEARAAIRIVGEPSGGSPNLVGDPRSLVLETTGWTVNVGTVWWQKSRAGADDPRLAFEPHVRVPVRWRDVAAGRDPALAAAVREALR